MFNDFFYKKELNEFITGELNINSPCEFRQYLCDIISNNNTVYKFVNQIKQQILSDNFIIIRDFGTNYKQFILLNLILSNKLFFSERVGSFLLTFSTRISAKTLHEDLESGGFHTDFSFHDTIPDFVSLQCLQKDPKFPYLGRNYISNVDKIFKSLIKEYGLTENYLLNIKFPYTFDKVTIWNEPFIKSDDKIQMKIHIKMIDISKLTDEHFINGVPLNELINQLALCNSFDFVLDKGDVVIFSNKFVIHKRGECSIDLINKKSRKLNSMRFFI